MVAYAEAGEKILCGNQIHHTGNGYYSVIYDITKEDGQLYDVFYSAAGSGKRLRQVGHRRPGYTVFNDHDEPYDGNGYATRYGHLKEIPFSCLAKKIKQGDIVGIMGSTGRVAGTHVHFQVL